MVSRLRAIQPRLAARIARVGDTTSRSLVGRHSLCAGPIINDVGSRHTDRKSSRQTNRKTGNVKSTGSPYARHGEEGVLPKDKKQSHASRSILALYEEVLF